MRKPDFSRRVAVTGLGIVSPVGADIPTAWANLTAGVSGLRQITYWDASYMECQAAGEVHDFDPNAWMDFKAVRRTDKNVVFGVAAAKQAAADAGIVIDATNADEVGVVFGSGVGGPGLMADAIETMKIAAPLGQSVLHRQHAARHRIRPDRHRAGRSRAEHVHRHGLLHGHPQHRRGGRGHPSGRLPHGHLRLDRDAPVRGRLRRLQQHAGHGHAARRRGPVIDLTAVRQEPQRLRAG